MSDDKNVKKSGDSLAPISEKNRIMGIGSYIMLWLGGCISIGTLTMGSAQLGKGLNLYQIFAAVLLGTTILVIGIVANDKFSYTTGAPYAVQLKSAYGTKGNIVPVMLRGLPAIVWYGFQSWLGGTAINEISKTLFGFDNVVLFFLLFQVLQIALSVKGFHGIKWVENIGGVVIVCAMIYMLYISITRYGSSLTDLISRKGTWGLPFVAAVIAFFGNSTTVMLNAGDYSRELKAGYKVPTRGIGYFISMVPATVMLGLIGAMASTATGNANPIEAFSTMVENKVLLVATLGFILFAQMTTNLASNVVPPAYAFMDAFKIKHKTSVILVGVLAVATCPWLLVTPQSAAGLDIFVKVYTAFFGPIFAVLITDFYVLHKGKYTKDKLDDLYNENGNHKGVNWAAIIATAVGAVIGIMNIDVSFFTATIPTALVYYFAMKYMASAKNFRKNTILEK